MDTGSPPFCLPTVTVRRNPRRRVRDTPSTVPDQTQPDAVHRREIRPFPLQDLIEADNNVKPSKPVEESDNIRVFLRVRPLDTNQVSKNGGGARNRVASRAILQKKDSEKKKRDQVCLIVNDSRSVTLKAPLSFDLKRVKNEVYEGFTHVFGQNSSQEEVYGAVMDPLVEDFIKGKGGLLAAAGPTGSGKTHTVFGSPREPGLVSRALRRLFNPGPGELDGVSDSSRSYYVSMFEICSEGGRKEKLYDLSSDGADLSIQQMMIKGLREVEVSTVVEAECVIARGMLKRATAETNANNQSSRSQCIVNVRKEPTSADNDAELPGSRALLTIVDLAGAEREKKTGNQGTRLTESNFINNTSMVFGLCLRSLLEHQKNPRKPLQKHWQNSLLTQYLRDYMEGKKRMTLILTAKPGETDYTDTSFLLRQASPYMKIKYNSVEEFSEKRPGATLIQVTKPKRRKFDEMAATLIDTRKASVDEHIIQKTEKTLKPSPAKLTVKSPSPNSATNKSSMLGKGYDKKDQKGRHQQIMRDFSRALWNVLKEYKRKLEVSENEVLVLKECLGKKKMKIVELEKELQVLRSHELCNKPVIKVSSCPSGESPVDSYESEAQKREFVHDFSKENHNQKSGDENNEGCQITVRNAEDLKGMASAVNDISSDDKETGSEKSPSMVPRSQVEFSPVANDNLQSDASAERQLLPGEQENVGFLMLKSQVPVTEDVNCSGRCRVMEFPPTLNKNDSCKPPDMEKPKRRLLPVASMLLKDMATLEVECSKSFLGLLPSTELNEEERSTKPTPSLMGKGYDDEDDYSCFFPVGSPQESVPVEQIDRGKKKNEEERAISQGSLSLVRLLKNNLHF